MASGQYRPGAGREAMWAQAALEVNKDTCGSRPAFFREALSFVIPNRAAKRNLLSLDRAALVVRANTRIDCEAKSQTVIIS